MNSAQKVLLICACVAIVIVAVMTISVNLKFPDFFLLSTLIITSTFFLSYSFNTRNNSYKKNQSNHPEIIVDMGDEANAKKIQGLMQMTQNQLYKLSSVFPFDLFPDRIYIEQKQVIIISKQFFATSQDYQILIKNILMPIVESSIFFSTLRLEVISGTQHDPPIVRYLKKHEALKAKRIISGLMICDKEGIDLTTLPLEELIKKVEEIGRFKIE